MLSPLEPCCLSFPPLQPAGPTHPTQPAWLPWTSWSRQQLGGWQLPLRQLRVLEVQLGSRQCPLASCPSRPRPPGRQGRVLPLLRVFRHAPRLPQVAAGCLPPTWAARHCSWLRCQLSRSRHLQRRSRGRHRSIGSCSRLLPTRSSSSLRSTYSRIRCNGSSSSSLGSRCLQVVALGGSSRWGNLSRQRMQQATSAPWQLQ